MSAPLPRPMTLEEFLAGEDRQEFDGFAPVATTGGTAAHAAIARNILRALGNQLVGKPCQIFGRDLKVQAAESIPDPVVIFEVLGDSTAATDRFAKNREYAATPSIRRHVMVEQGRIGATVLTREPGGWLGRLIGEADTLAMPEIGASLPLAARYAGLDLPMPPGIAT